MKILALHPWGVAVVLVIGFGLLSSPAFARITPEDIVKARKTAYEEKVKNFFPSSQQKLARVLQLVAQINKQRTDRLSEIMNTQAAILDEYERRQGESEKESISKARYWITYAHEAVAYQAAKIYIVDLSTEQNIKNDLVSLVSLFQPDLLSARSKVIYSQQILKETLR